MFSINPNIFKAYDIRGVYQQDFDDTFSYHLGLAYVEFRKNDSNYNSNIPLQIAVASDMRISSPVLKKQLIQGLLDAGVQVIDLGIISTPSFYFAVGNYNYNGGIMITASHNPKEWNGFKLVKEKGVAISGNSGIKEIKKYIINHNLSKASRAGSLKYNKAVLDDELKYSLQYVNTKNIKPFKVVIDPANGMGDTYLENLFSHLPGELIKINCKLDGTFPAHEADPLKKENLKEIEKVIIEHQADLGISTDGDGDRVFFIDNKARVINPAIIRGLLSQLFLLEKPGAKIGYDVRPGKITTDMIINSGGIPIMTRVGHSLIKEQMIKEDLYFAGESSGHFFLKTNIGCFEFPMIMILKLLEKFSQISEPLSSFINLYNKYVSSGEINRKVEDKKEILKRIKEYYKNGKINDLDGISVSYDNFWFNVRLSNTENVIRLNLEAVNQATMEEKRDEVLKLIK